MKKRIIRKSFVTIIALVLFIMNAYGSVNALTYTYDYWKNIIPSTEGLSFRETYYANNIFNASGNKELLKFSNLIDFSVYNGKIYLLDSCKTASSKISFASGNRDVTGASYIYIINQNMQWEKAVNEFPMTTEVVEKLNTYYHFTTPLNEITYEQYTTVEIADRAPYAPSSVDPSIPVLRFNNASGISVVDDGIYVADTENSRIVKLDFNYQVVDVYLTPTDATFYQPEIGTSVLTIAEGSYVFKPLKVAIDVSGRVYCISRDIYQGIIEFSRNTEFNRFLGKNEVVANPLKKFWAKLFSDTQLQTMTLDLPAMFTNITMDAKGFLYATSYPDEDDPLAANVVKAINTSGKDVMRRNGYVKPDGDVSYLVNSNIDGAVVGSSSIVDVAVNSIGNFTIVDSTRGRIFTYDGEGNLLYIAGEQPGGQGNSNKSGLSSSISTPVAVNYFNRINENGDTEELLLVLDSKSKSLIVYETTEFGKMVNTATYLYQNGMVEEAEQYWRTVEKMNTNYELAYLGIGKSLLRQGKYEEAMEYFKKAHNGTYYSKAFSNYRDNVLKENFNWIMFGVILIIVLIGVRQYFKYMKKRKARILHNEGGDE